MRAATWSEQVPRTHKQDLTARRLEATGYIIVCEPESVFNAAMLLEGPPDGRSYYVLPDGTIAETLK